MTEAKVGCHLWHSEADEGDVREQLVELAEGGNAEPGGVRRSQGREGVTFLLFIAKQQPSRFSLDFFNFLKFERE